MLIYCIFIIIMLKYNIILLVISFLTHILDCLMFKYLEIF